MGIDMAKVLERLDSAAGKAVSKQASESVASLYRVTPNTGHRLEKPTSFGGQRIEKSRQGSGSSSPNLKK
jgi:hypothetical protein